MWFVVFAILSLGQLTKDAENWNKDIENQIFEKNNGREVTLKGFYVTDPEGKTCLATQPSLRSCCTKELPLSTLRIILEDPLPEESLQKVVKVSGVLSVEPELDEQDRLQNLYRLTAVKNHTDLGVRDVRALFLAVFLFLAACILWHYCRR